MQRRVFDDNRLLPRGFGAIAKICLCMCGLHLAASHGAESGTHVAGSPHLATHDQLRLLQREPDH